MKKTVLFFAMLAAGFANAGIRTDYANVVSSTPVYERSVMQQCVNVPVTRVEETSDDERVGGSIVGGVLGGVLGHQIGKGHGRDAATVAGAIAGTLAGHSMAERPSVTTGTRRECREEGRRNLVGYSVTYDYHGEQSTIQMSYDPGPTLEVQVSVQPIIR